MNGEALRPKWGGINEETRGIESKPSHKYRSTIKSGSQPPSMILKNIIVLKICCVCPSLLVKDSGNVTPYNTSHFDKHVVSQVRASFEGTPPFLQRIVFVNDFCNVFIPAGHIWFSNAWAYVFFFGRHGAYLAKSHFPQTATRFKSLVRQVNVKFTPVPTIFPSQTRNSCKILTGTGTVKNLANLEGKTVLTEFWSYIYYLNVKPRCGVQVEMWTRGVREGRTSVFVLLHTVFSIPICWYNQWVWRLIVALLIVANLSGVLKPRLHTTRELVLFVNMTVLLQITRVGKAFTTVWLATLPDQNIIAFFFVIFFVFAPFFFRI